MSAIINTMKKITVKLDKQTIEVSKLPLGKYAELLKAIKEIPKHVAGMEKRTADEFLEQLPTLVGSSLPDFVNIFTIATPLTAEEVNELGLDEAVKLAVAIWEVNNYKEVYEQIKKITAQTKSPQTT